MIQRNTTRHGTRKPYTITSEGHTRAWYHAVSIVLVSAVMLSTETGINICAFILCNVRQDSGKQETITMEN